MVETLVNALLLSLVLAEMQIKVKHSNNSSCLQFTFPNIDLSLT